MSMLHLLMEGYALQISIKATAHLVVAPHSHGNRIMKKSAHAVVCNPKMTGKIHKDFVLRSHIIEALTFVLLIGYKVLKDSWWRDPKAGPRWASTARLCWETRCVVTLFIIPIRQISSHRFSNLVSTTWQGGRAEEKSASWVLNHMEFFQGGFPDRLFRLRYIRKMHYSWAYTSKWLMDKDKRKTLGVFCCC